MIKEAARSQRTGTQFKRTRTATATQIVRAGNQPRFTVQSLLAPGGQRQGVRISVANLVESIRIGIPSSAIDVVAVFVQIPKAEVARVLHINARTLARRRGGVLSSEESEKVVRMGRVMERAAEVFGDMGGGAEWLKIPNQALNGQTPLSLLDTGIGSETVMDTLGRIEHGVFA